MKYLLLQCIRSYTVDTDVLLQHGFVPRSSCLTNRLLTEQWLTQIMDLCGVVDVVFFDFTAIFPSSEMPMAIIWRSWSGFAGSSRIIPSGFVYTVPSLFLLVQAMVFSKDRSSDIFCFNCSSTLREESPWISISCATARTSAPVNAVPDSSGNVWHCLQFISR